MINSLPHDRLIGGYLVPKGYCEAGDMLAMVRITTGVCVAWSDYITSKSTQEFLAELSRHDNRPIYNDGFDASAQPQALQPLIIVIKGGEPLEQGTWVHTEVAIHLAMWASPKFAVWAAKALRAVLNNQFEALDPEAQEIKKQLEQSWAEIRNQGKLTRRNFTDAIKGYLDTHEVSEGYRKWIYANCSDKLNKSVFGKRAKEIRIERCQYTGLIRDTHKNPDLRLLDRMEDYAARLIGQEDVEPMDAVNSAIAFYRPKYANQLG